MQWKLDLLLWPRDRVPSGSMLTLPDPRRPDRANPPTNFWWSLFFDSTGMIYMHCVPTGQTVNKEYYVEVLRKFRKRFHQKRPALFKSGRWHFHQDNTPVHNSILVTDYLTKMGIKTVAWRCPWYNCYRRRKWTRRHEFKSWTRLIAFHIALIPLGKVWIQLFSLQLWVNSRTD